jgi:superfamily II DNA or RNA helicase
MRIRVGASLTITGASDQWRELRAAWAIKNPAFVAAERAGRWTGQHDEYIYAATGSPSCITLPRGLLREVLDRWQADVVADPIQDYTADAPPAATTILRDYQDRAVAAALAYDDGYIVAPCGAGKTTIGLGVIRRRQQRALVLVHTRDLLAQWKGEISRQLGEWGEHNVTVATVQGLWGTAARAPKPLPLHGLLLMDECHHAPSRCFYEVVGRSRARYRYGLTATPDREDGLGPVIGWTFGPEMYRVERHALLGAGHLVRPRLEVIRTDFEPETVYTRAGELDWTAIVSQLAEDEDRTHLIGDLISRDEADGHVVLVLTTRVEHADAIAAECAARGVRAHVATGSYGAKRRSERLAEVRAGFVRVLIATQLADEGLDLPVLDRLILALPSRAFSRTVQRIGRIMRPAPGKGVPVVYDLADDHPACWGQFRQRRKAFDAACGNGNG